jgi:sodium pump decarboxylase gamma subunit
MKRILLVLSMLTCLCLLAACQSTTTTDSSSTTSSSGITEDQYQSYGEQLLNQIAEMDDETLDGYISGGQISEGLAAGLTSWKEIKDELGSLESITETEVTMDDDTVTVVINAKFSKREGTYTLIVDTDGNVTSSSFDKVYTTKEIFKKAVLNTLMGMGTVFVVLIFISFIISLFKYIPNIQAKFAKKAEPVEVAAPAEPAEAFAAQEDDLVDDGELVAVITAAVCAAMACEGNAVSKDGLIVRSIRRSRK